MNTSKLTIVRNQNRRLHPLTRPASLLAAVLLLVLSAQPVFAAVVTSYQLAPTPADLYDLDHTRYYTWGIDRPWPADQTVVSAVLAFDNIRNWDSSPNTLYIHLLDTAPLGVTVAYDNLPGDYFNTQGVLLHTWQNLPKTAQDLSYVFTADQLTALQNYAADGRFALGLDPDCHYYNSGVSLTVGVIPIIPEPASLALLALGSLLHTRRRPHLIP